MNEFEIDGKKLEALILETWQDFDRLKTLPETASLIVPDSMPLLWFGDLAAYAQSNVRILTLSKNPSDAEFGQNQRFDKLSPTALPTLSMLANPLKRKVAIAVLTENLTAYKSQLNQYFQRNPNKWFRQLNKFLPVFEAGYADASNVALHADLFTPMATKPVWPGLTKAQQACFDSKIAALLDILQPQLLLTSLSQANLKILLDKIGSGVQIYEALEPGKAAKYVRAYRLPSGLIVVNGRNFQGTYFGGMTEEFVKRSLSEIRDLL